MTVNLLEEKANRAGDKPITVDTGISLLDVDPETAADFLAVRDWKARGRWVDNIIIESLEQLGQVLPGPDEDDAPSARSLMRETAKEMRVKLAALIVHLERLRPLVLDCAEAMRVYRVSGDPDHVARAIRFFSSERAELEALRPNTGCMVLRNLTFRLQELSERGER